MQKQIEIIKKLGFIPKRVLTSIDPITNQHILMFDLGNNQMDCFQTYSHFRENNIESLPTFATSEQLDYQIEVFDSKKHIYELIDLTK